MKNKNLPIIIIIPIVITFLLLLISNNEVNQVPTTNEEELGEKLTNVATDSEDLFEPNGSKNEDAVDNTEDKDTPVTDVDQEPLTIEGANSQKDDKMDEQMTTQKSYTITLNTSEGPISIKLNDKETPKTVDNFVKLSKEGFYDNTIFHRVMEDFMIQGGDPEGNGTGGPGYNIDDEPFTGEYTRGTVAMANTGQPNSAGSQFFILHKDYPLPKTYVIFGKVSEGLDVVDKIATAPVSRGPSGEMSKPINPVTIETIEILEAEN